MSYTLGVGSDGTAQTAQVVWSGDLKTRRFRSDNNFLAWITTIFDVADAIFSGGAGSVAGIVETLDNNLGVKYRSGRDYKIYSSRPTLVMTSYEAEYAYGPTSGAYISETPSILGDYGSLVLGPSYTLAGVSAIDNIAKANTAALLSLNFPDLELIVDNLVGPYPGADSTTTLNLPKLKAVGGTMFAAGGPPAAWAALTSLNVPELEYATQLSTSDLSVIPALNFPKLRVVSSWSMGGTCNALATISAPVLETVASVFAIGGNCPLVTTLNFPLLKYCGTLLASSVAGWTALNTFTAPNVVRWLSQAGPNCIDLNNGNALANVSIGTAGTLKSVFANVSISNCALTAASVQNILVALASLDGTAGTTTWGAGKTVDLSGGTSSGVAALTPAAAAARATLLARGATVTLNP